MYIHASLLYFIGLRPTTTQKPGVQAAAPIRYNRYAEFAKARVKKIAVQRLVCRMSAGGVDHLGFHHFGAFIVTLW